MELRIDSITKEFKDKTAVNNFTTTLENGIYGLLGPNGSGKTTLMRMLADVVKPTKGAIYVDGKDKDILDDDYRDLVGYLPQDIGFYKNFTAKKHLAYIAALKGIDLSIPEGKITAIIGQTGSGKSTLVQHLNGLLIPTAGTLDICGFHIQPLLKIKDVKQLRKEVGLVFQFPEYQLFEETIAKDIAFGPKNFGTSEEDATQLVKKVLPVVGLDENYLDRSPFDLSGGQKRRVAIAGILVLNPKVLVLDEPTAGLDPQGAQEMMTLFMNLNKKEGKTVLLVTHDMEHVMNYCDHVIVLSHGEAS